MDFISRFRCRGKNGGLGQNMYNHQQMVRVIAIWTCRSDTETLIFILSLCNTLQYRIFRNINDEPVAQEQSVVYLTVRCSQVINTPQLEDIWAAQ